MVVGGGKGNFSLSSNFGVYRCVCVCFHTSTLLVYIRVREGESIGVWSVAME